MKSIVFEKKTIGEFVKNSRDSGKNFFVLKIRMFLMLR